MLGLLSYGLFLVVLLGLMRVASVGSRRDRTNAAAAMLASRMN